MVDKGLVGKTIGLGKNDFGNSGKIYAWFLAPRIKCYLVIDDFGVILAKGSFERYSEEHRRIKLKEYISLSEGNIFFGDFRLIGQNRLMKSKYHTEKIECYFAVIVLKTMK